MSLKALTIVAVNFEYVNGFWIYSERQQKGVKNTRLILTETSLRFVRWADPL